jgi:hypothetical protein
MEDIMRHVENNNTGGKSTDPWTGVNIIVLKSTLFSEKLQILL